MSDCASIVSKCTENLWRKKCGILCVKCNIIYTKKPNYLRHCGEKHTGQPIIFTCALCYKEIDSYSKFRNHCYRHVISDRYKCDICNKSFSQKSHLNEHINACHNSSIYCSICMRTFATDSNLKKHIHEVHIAVEYCCDDCGKVLHSASSLKIHQSTHIHGKYFICDSCGERFTRKTNLQTHIKSHSTSDSFVCNVCLKKFPHKAKLNAHLLTHSDTRNYECKICKKFYKTESYLKKHLNRHTEKKSFSCNVCDKKFFNVKNLNDHVNTHTGEKPYNCRFCTKKFANYSNCIKHMNRHTEKRSFSCNICDKKFFINGNLKNHMNTHTGEKPYSCIFCTVKFADYSNCIKHMKSHKTDPKTGKPIDLKANKDFRKIEVQNSVKNLENNNDINIYSNALRQNIECSNQPNYISESIISDETGKSFEFSLQDCLSDDQILQFAENVSNINSFDSANEAINLLYHNNTQVENEMYKISKAKPISSVGSKDVIWGAGGGICYPRV